MIDGVKSLCNGLNVGLWQNNPLLNFNLSVSEQTGELFTHRKEAKSKSLRFTALKSEKSNDYTCLINGSLHKYNNADGTNYNDFSFSQLCDTINSLELNYSIDAKTTNIQRLEVGVNIELDYSPEVILKNIICHKGKPFESINCRNRKMGVICEHTDYSIKIYNKSLQSGITDKHILRYEVKLNRSRTLEPYKIETLADLKDVEKVAPLLQLLQARLKEIVFFDYKFNDQNLTETKQLAWSKYSNPRYWEALNKRSYYKARKQLNELINKYNCIDWQTFLLNKTTQKYNELLQLPTQQNHTLTPTKQTNKAEKEATFSTLVCMSENIPQGCSKAKPTKKKVCTCLSCGRELIGQKKGSKFCSEKIYGKEAKQCRNKDSNRRLTLKRKIYRAMEVDEMLLITYKENDCTYSDTLSSKELSLSKEWLDKVMSVQRVEVGKTLKGKEARKYMKKFKALEDGIE